MRVHFLLRLTIGIVLTILISGCSTFRSGGAPEPSFNIDKDLAELSKQFGESASIERYYAAPSEEARNWFISSRLVAINLRYIQFLRKSTAERQAFDSANDILIMGLGLVGAAISPTTTKTILAATSAAVSGTKTTLDKNYYLEKTMPALIASMNAQRLVALAPILQGTRHSIADYPFETAVMDLHAYYNAGTYLGAIEAIQTDAGAKAVLAQNDIQLISSMPTSAVLLKISMTKAVGALTAADLEKAKSLLVAAGQTVPAELDLGQAQLNLQDLVRKAKSPKLHSLINENLYCRNSTNLCVGEF